MCRDRVKYPSDLIKRGPLHAQCGQVSKVMWLRLGMIIFSSARPPFSFQKIRYVASL